MPEILLRRELMNFLILYRQRMASEFGHHRIRSLGPSPRALSFLSRLVPSKAARYGIPKIVHRYDTKRSSVPEDLDISNPRVKEILPQIVAWQHYAKILHLA